MEWERRRSYFLSISMLSLAVIIMSLLFIAGSPGQSMASGTTTTDQTVNLTSGGSITGVVTDLAGNPLSNINVSLVNSTSGQTVTTDANGRYTLVALPTGQYGVWFDPSTYNSINGTNLVGEYYNANPDYPQNISVTQNQITGNINAQLSAGGGISGSVTDASGNPMAGIFVEFEDQFGVIMDQTSTDSSGNYFVQNLFPGTYKVTFSANGYDSQNGANYLDTNYADPVTVTASNVTANINAQMPVGGSISGRVTDANGNALVGINVSVLGLTQNSGWATTDANGNYTINGLYPDQYTVEFSAYDTPYVAEYYNQKGYTNPDTVSVALGQNVSGINAQLQIGGVITGKVTDTKGNPVVGIQVSASDSNGDSGDAYTDDNGNYTIQGLATGSYRLTVYTYDQPQYVQAEKPDIVVEQGQTVAGLNLQLAFGGTISGTVTDTNGNPIPNVYVDILDSTSMYSFEAQTDVNGDYTISGLSTGNYKIRFSEFSGDYADQWYLGNSEAQAVPVSVVQGQATTGIDLQMQPAASISGVVIDAGGNPVPDVEVDVYNSDEYGGPDNTALNNTIIASVTTDSTGNYTIGSLPAGSYKVAFNRPSLDQLGSPYGPQWNGGATSFYTASPIDVAIGQIVQGVDAQLQAGAEISGTVKDQNGNPIAGVEVKVYDAAAGFLPDNGGSNAISYTYTDTYGNYQITGLPEGAYKLEFGPGESSSNNTAYATQWFNGQNAFTTANVITLLPGQSMSNLNTVLAAGGICGSISGRVEDAKGQALNNMMVQVFDSNGNFAGSCFSNALGDYTVSYLDPGNYTVKFIASGDNSLSDQWYGNTSTMNTAQPVTVVSGQDTPNINAQLQPGGILTGQVLGVAGTPVPDATVEIYDPNQELMDTTFSDASGYYTTVLPTGTYKIKIQDPNYISQWYNNQSGFAAAGTVAITQGQTTMLNLQLQSGQALTGKVTGTSGYPLFDITVNLYDGRGNLLDTTKTGLDGSYQFIVADGSYKLDFEPAYYNQMSGTYYNAQWYNGQTDLASAGLISVTGQPVNNLNVQLSAPAPETKGCLDTDLTGKDLSGSVTLSGWFLDNTGVGSIQVLVDGIAEGQAVYGDPRPDVAAAFPEYNNPNAGFHYNLDTTVLNDGAHTLTLLETSANGQVTTVSEGSFTTYNLPARAALDTPNSGDSLSGTANVSGWLIDGLGVSQVDVLVDGNVVGEAIYGDPRPDVAAAFPAYNNPNSGFHYSLDTTGLSVGSHTLAIQETAQDGSQQIVATQDFSVAAAAKGNLDDITDGTSVSGTLNLHGWYLDQSGVAKIQVVVDGNVLGEAAYGDARPDVAAAYPEFNNPNSGYHYSLDTTTLTAGSHSLVIREISNDGTSRDLPARTINVTLPDKGFLDGVDNGSTLSGTVNLSGWYLSGTSVAKVEVLVDGNAVGQASYGDARPDVYAAFPAYNNQNSGYHFSLNTTTLAAGSHTLTLRETGTDGTTNDFAVRTFSVAAARRGTVDDLDDGAALSGTFDLYGWYLDSAGVAKLQILVDGNVVGEATYGDARPDVYAAFPDYNNQNAGYHYDLDTSALSAGTHSLVVREISMDGSQNDLTARTFATSLPPKGTIDGITDGMTVSGTYNVSGWFLDANTVQTVEVLVDGQVVGTATYGDARPDVAAVFPAYNNPNSGFNYSLDTSLLSAGSHTLTVMETSATGVITTLPEYSIVVGS